MQSREEIIQAILNLRQIFAAINSTPMVFVFKDFAQGQPILAVGKNADMKQKLSSIIISQSNENFGTALQVYNRYKNLFMYDDVCFFSESPTSFTFFRGYDFSADEGFNEAAIDLFTNFVYEIICDREDSVYEYLMQWIAQIVQQPWSKLETSLVILGETRKGKTTFTNILCHLLGRYAVPNITDMNHVLGMFNSVFENKRLVIVNEVESVAESRRMNFERLKTLISDKTVSYNRKYGAMGQGVNSAHFIFTSNNPVPLPIAPNDARFVVMKVSPDRKMDTDFFRQLHSTLTKEFFENLMYFFMNLDISGFEHRDIPLTEAKRIIMEACASPVETFIQECWRTIYNVTGPDLFQLFKTFCKESSIPIPGFGKNIFLAEMFQFTGEPTQKKVGKRNLKVYNLKPEVIAHLEEIDPQIEPENDGDTQ